MKKTKNLDISNTQYGLEVARKKRGLESAADHFSREERDELQKKCDAMDAEDAGYRLPVGHSFADVEEPHSRIHQCGGVCNVLFHYYKLCPTPHYSPIFFIHSIRSKS